MRNAILTVVVLLILSVLARRWRRHRDRLDDEARRERLARDGRGEL